MLGLFQYTLDVTPAKDDHPRGRIVEKRLLSAKSVVEGDHVDRLLWDAGGCCGCHPPAVGMSWSPHLSLAGAAEGMEEDFLHSKRV